MPSLVRFLREYLRPAGRVQSVETEYSRGEERLPATVYAPPGGLARPGWVVLHGLTHTGREHPTLVRFVRAVAAAGNVVLVPDIPEWRDLRVAPAVTVPTIRAAVRALHDRDDVVPEQTGLFGFSFGATQALIASCDADIESILRCIVAWGGYSDVHRMFTFGMTGETDLDGKHWRVQPDLYGCWVMVGNYLTHMPGYEDAGDVAAAVHALAREAGRRQIQAGDSVYDPVKRELRETLPPGKRELFDLITRPSNAPPLDVERVRPMALQLADAALRVDPLMDPAPFLARLKTPVLFAHGRDDRLIAWTETVRLARAVPPDVLRDVAITRLYGHSHAGSIGRSPITAARETWRFLRTLRHILRLPLSA